MLPPAEAPPTMKPRAGFAFSDAALAAAHFSAPQESLMPVGKGCSGARLGGCQLHTFILQRGSREWLAGLTGTPH